MNVCHLGLLRVVTAFHLNSFSSLFQPFHRLLFTSLARSSLGFILFFFSAKYFNKAKATATSFKINNKRKKWCRKKYGEKPYCAVRLFGWIMFGCLFFSDSSFYSSVDVGSLFKFIVLLFYMALLPTLFTYCLNLVNNESVKRAS